MTPPRLPSRRPTQNEDAHRKERLEFSKTCCDRFLEVCKARIAIGTFFAVTVVTLTGFGLQNRRFELFVIAAVIPFGLLLMIDILLKSRYAAPFLYVGLAIEHEMFGDESAAMLFLRFTKADKAKYISAISSADKASGYAAFRARYAFRGMRTKLSFLFSVTIAQLALAFSYYPR
jgi:hypothetical protein